MQKIFIKYTVLILTAAILLILFINFLFTSHTLENQQFDTFQIKIEQIIHTLKSNQAELDLMNENLNVDYLTRAKAASYVLDQSDEIAMDVSQMQYLAKLLNVDELHYIDGDGIIASASVSQYIGMDMADHPQTRAFLSILESGRDDAYLIQDAQPNAAAGKIMQYIGVKRKHHEGFVQVGFEPTRLMAARSRNTYDYLFSRFPTDGQEAFFVVDLGTGEVLGHSENMEQDFTAECYQLDQLLQCQKGAYQRGVDGEKMYIVSQGYEQVLICAILPQTVLRRKQLDNAVRTLIYLLCVEGAVLLLLYYLVRKKVVDGIHSILESLGAITNGNLDTTVAVGGNREFEELSGGINTMVKSIVSISDRISSIIDMSGVPLAAFEYERGAQSVFATSGLGELLNLSQEQVAKLCRSAERFDQYICEITQTPVEGESDVYRMENERYVRIHLSESPERKLGVITDVTRDIEEKNWMRHENTHDALTGLCQYRHFQSLAGEALRRLPPGKAAAIVMIDLDDFKRINDTFGHDAGDRYLQSFASVLRSMPPERVLSARRSGDEFCMMLYNCDSHSEVVEHLNRFYEALAKNPVSLSGTVRKTISASSGFVCTSDAGADVAWLLSLADEVLYQTKNKIKGTYGEYFQTV